MSGSAASAAYLILVVFLGGVTIGVFAAMAWAVRQEDRLYTLSVGAPSAGAGGARWLTGFGGAGWHQRPRSWGR
jgi:hypothetical protein